MNSITIIWAVVTTICLTLAAMNLLVWFRLRSAKGSLIFALLAVATAGMGSCEWLMMRAQTPADYAAAVRYLHVPALFVILALIGFVHWHLQAGRPWLAWTICGLRVAGLVLNFAGRGENLNYLEIRRLRQVPFLGDTVAIAEGVPNPWMLLAQLPLLLLVWFAVDAAIAVVRRGSPRSTQATSVCIVVFVLAGSVQSVLVPWGLVDWPFVISWLIVPLVGVMAYELSMEVVRAASLRENCRQNEIRLKTGADLAGLGFYELANGTDVIYADARTQAVFGLPPDQSRGWAAVVFWREHVAPDHVPLIEAITERLTDGRREAMSTEYRYNHPDRGEIWIEHMATVIRRDADGRQTHIVGVVRDITRNKQDEQEIAEQRSELAHVNRVSTLGQLASSIAHELNQPLGAILRNAEAGELLLAETPPDLEEVRAILLDIRQDDQRAGQVIEKMRALMKKQPPRHARLDVRLLLDDSVGLIQPDASRRGILLRLDIPDSLPEVVGDRVQLQQVLLILLLNAMDAAESGASEHPTVTARAQVAGAVLEATVSDNGPGIPPTGLEKVFEPFFTTKDNGMGLGLTIARSIVKDHGGKLWAESGAGTGATFTLALPIAGEA